MELITLAIDFIMHIDRYLEVFVQTYGQWVYALLFLIIFVETGLVVMPFLPGDSLLFVVGALCGMGVARAFDAPLGLKSALICAAIASTFWFVFAQLLGVGLGPAMPWLI